MEKISKEQQAEVLRDAAATIRKLASENKEKGDKIAAMELRERTVKVAASMHQKGINTDASQEDLVDHLEKAAKDGRLEVIEQAIDLVGPDMGAKIAQVRTDDAGTGSGSSDFERYLVGGVG